MLPHRFNLRDLDKGIRRVVVNLNRIPDVFTYTTCEGHVWRDCPIWPAKDGWVHFNIPKGRYSDFMDRTLEFVKGKNGLFELSGPRSFYTSSHDEYTMSGLFEDHEHGELFDRLDDSGQAAYFDRADERKVVLLSGWADWNSVIVAYLRENFGSDFKRLPFIHQDR